MDKGIVTLYSVLFIGSFAYGIKSKIAQRKLQQELEQTQKLLHSVLARNDYLQEKQASTRQLRHDMKHHLQAILGYVGKGELHEVQQYIISLNSIKACLRQEQESGNTLVDSVVAASLSKACASTQVCCDMLLPQELPFAAPDISILFGNLIDNAVEATGLHYTDFINIEAKIRKNCLVIVVANSFLSGAQGPVHLQGSTKEPRHKGIGLKNIQAVVDKYEGVLNVQGAHNVFTVTAILRLKAGAG